MTRLYELATIVTGRPGPSRGGNRGTRGTQEPIYCVGTDHAGKNLAGLYSLVATCEANDINPVAYFADVLVRVQSHPASRIDEPLPHNWRSPNDSS